MEQNENVFEALASRYSVGFSQQIADQLSNIQQRDINLFDIMALNELADEFRQEIKKLFALYHAARNKCVDSNKLMHRVYASHKTILVRRQISDLWRLYQMARADSRELTNEYMHRLNLGASRSLPSPETEYRTAA